MGKETTTISKYIDPCTDWGFKRIFGTDANKDLLIAFLNSIFFDEPKPEIKNIDFNKNEHKGNTRNDRNVVFDITCTGDNDERFIIEMQREGQEFFKERAVFYASRLVTEQGRNEKDGKWNFDIRDVYMIGILENFVLDEGQKDEYFHKACWGYRRDGKIFLNKIWCIFLELRNFTKVVSALDTELDKWLYVLKNMNKLESIPVYLQQPVFEKLFNIAEYANLTKEEQMLYDQDLKHKWDNENVRAYVEKRGFEKGREEGLEQGLQKGLQKGREVGLEQGFEQGIEQGFEKGIEQVARELKKMGVPLNQINIATKLPVEKIENF